MKKFFGNIQTLLIVVLVVIILLMRSCSGESDVTEPKIITKIETKWDTVKVDRPIYVPKIVDRVVVDVDTFNLPIDTAAILTDYYSKVIYNDTIVIDSLGTITISDTITQNYISYRGVVTELNFPTKIITNNVYLNKRELYGGISISGQPTQLEMLSGELLYKNKKRNAYGVGVGVNPDFQPMYTFRMYWKIGK